MKPEMEYSLMTQLISEGRLELGSSQRPPLFKVESNIIVIEELNELPLNEWIYTEEVDGQWYLWVNATKLGTISKTFSGSGFWENDRVATASIQPYIEIFGIENMVQFDEFIEIKKVANMTIEEYKEMIIEKADIYFDTIGTFGFESKCLGELKTFDSDFKSVSQINGLVSIAQQNLIDTLMGLDDEPQITSWKERGVDLCYEWTNEQVIALGKDLAKAISFLEHNREVTIVSINACSTREELDLLASSLV